MSGKKIGVFGGTFDPPHLGHIILANEALFQFKLDKVLWVITPKPPHKEVSSISPLSFRLNLVNEVMKMVPQFQLSEVDINRAGPHYAVDTLRLLREMYPNAELWYLIGGDSLIDLPKWYKPSKVIDYCHHLGVMKRIGDEINFEKLNRQFPGIDEKLNFIDVPLMEISSTQIRKRIRNHEPYRFFVPEVVFNVLKNSNQYQD